MKNRLEILKDIETHTGVVLEYAIGNTEARGAFWNETFYTEENIIDFLDEQIKAMESYVEFFELNDNNATGVKFTLTYLKKIKNKFFGGCV